MRIFRVYTRAVQINERLAVIENIAKRLSSTMSTFEIDSGFSAAYIPKFPCSFMHVCGSTNFATEQYGGFRQIGRNHVGQRQQLFLEKGVLLAPAKAANAGGVATSALEMSQNSMRYSWTFEEVDEKLDKIMTNIFDACQKAAKEYNLGTNYVAGANIAAFDKVSKAMLAQGLI